MRVAHVVVGSAALCAQLLCASRAASQGAQDSGVSLPAIHGFISQGFIKTSDNNYLVRSERGSFEFAEVGLNVTQSLTGDLTAGMQLFARDLGPSEDYSARFDWFYVAYRLADWLEVRAGRAKIPYGLYNEASDIDAARTPILLPQSVYPINSRDFLLAVTGGHLSGYVPFGDAGAIEYRAFAGTNHLEVVNRPSRQTHVESLSTPLVAGGRLLWETPLTGLSLAGSGQFIHIDGSLFYEPELVSSLIQQGAVPDTFSGLATYDLQAVLLVGSLEYTAGDLLLATEYSRWLTRFKGEPPGAFPAGRVWSERAHAMASVRVTGWLTPGAYYSVMFPDVDDRRGRDSYQHDVATSLRFDLTTNWLLKLEGHYMLGTAGTSALLNDDTLPSRLDPNWLVLLAKTTAYF